MMSETLGSLLPAPVQEKYRFVSNVGFGWPHHVYRIGTIRGALARPVFGLSTAVITSSFSMIASSDGVLQRALPNAGKTPAERRPERSTDMGGARVR